MNASAFIHAATRFLRAPDRAVITTGAGVTFFLERVADAVGLAFPGASARQRVFRARDRARGQAGARVAPVLDLKALSDFHVSASVVAMCH